MISMTGTPAAIINAATSPQEISYLVATDAPVIFTIQRNEGTIDTAADQAGNLRLTLIAGHQITTGDQIGVYDAGLDKMITGTATLVVSSPANPNVFDTNIAWEARYAADLEYVLNYSKRTYYYLEMRLKVNGIYQTPSMRFTPNTKGLIRADVSPYLKSEVSGEKIGNYINDSDAETNQSGEFEVEYRERYSGDTNTWTSEGNTWYYVYGFRSKEQGANLHEYVATATQEGEFFNEFSTPIWNLGTPMDLQFWWPPDYAALNAVLRQYDASNNLLSLSTSALDTQSIGKLCSVKVDLDTIEGLTRYMTLSIEE